MEHSDSECIPTRTVVHTPIKFNVAIADNAREPAAG